MYLAELHPRPRLPASFLPPFLFLVISNAGPTFCLAVHLFDAGHVVFFRARRTALYTTLPHCPLSLLSLSPSLVPHPALQCFDLATFESPRRKSSTSTLDEHLENYHPPRSRRRSSLVDIAISQAEEQYEYDSEAIIPAHTRTVKAKALSKDSTRKCETVVDPRADHKLKGFLDKHSRFSSLPPRVSQCYEPGEIRTIT